MKQNVKKAIARLAFNHLPTLTGVFLGVAMLLLAAPARAQIALQDGSTLINFHATPNTTNFTVTAGASVLVVQMIDKGAAAAGAEPATLSWGGQTLTRAVSEPDTASTFRDCTIYYLYNPTPGTQTISATVAAASIDLQVFTLSGVNTAIPPVVGAINLNNGQVQSLTVPNIPAGGWAAVNAMINSAGTTGTITSPTSGTVNVAYDTAQLGPDLGMGYVSNLNPGLAIFTASNTAASGKFVVVAAVFSPVESGPATITLPPVPVTAFAGESATFVVGATGANLTFQWSVGATPILNATNAVLTVTNLNLNQSGNNYSVVVTSASTSTSANSTPVALTVNPPLLQHRYSFVSDASDSVGGAAWNGTLIAGNNPATINNGLSLPGTGTSGTPSGYVALPNGIVAGDTSVTVECWVTQNTQRTFAEIWSFGILGGTVNFGMIPFSSSGDMRTAFTPNGGEVDIHAPGLPTGTEEYLALTYNNSTLTGNLYLNGVLDGTVILPNTTYSPGSFGTNFVGSTTNDQIGRDPFNGDLMFNGTVYELRIWHGAVPQRYISASALLGPGTVVNNDLAVQSAVFGTVASSMIATETQPGTVYVTMTQTGASPLLATGDVTNWTSGDTTVLTVNSSGVISAVGPGTTTISAQIGGLTATSSSITVNPQVLQHRYSFVSDASDSVGGANGTLMGPGTGAAATINNGLILPGTTGGTQSGYVTLPSGIILGDTSITVECWMTQAAARTWAEVWDFGVTGSTATNYALIAVSPTPDMRAASIPNGGEVDVHAPPLPSGVEEYVTVTYNDSTGITTLYTNGVKAGSVSTAIAPNVLYNTAYNANGTYSPGIYGGAAGTTLNLIGADVFNDAQFDGTVYELRIWNGAVSPVYEAVSSAAGPSVVINSTTASALAVSVPSSTMSQNGTQQAVLTGTFPQITASIPGNLAVWSSGDPTILTVNSNGLITAVGTGYTTISATFQGLLATSSFITNTTTVPIVNTPPASTNLNVSDTAVFSVAAVGGGLGYQWSFDGTKILNATNSTLTLTNITLANQGSYVVVITNSLGTNTPTAAVLNETPILENEWSFNDAPGSPTAIDSISGSNITLFGNTTLSGSVLTLPATGSSDYAQFPNGIVSTETSITIETWLTDTGGFGWAVPWCFANSTADYIQLIPTAARAPDGLWVAFNEGAEKDLIDVGSAPLQTGVEAYITLTYDAQLHTAIMYSNGVQIGINTGVTNANGSSITPASLGFTTQNYLGHDLFPDPFFKGTIDEMRIWNLVVSPLYVAVSAAAGPNVVVTSVTPVPGSLAVNATTTMPGDSTQQATVTENFPAASGVNLTSFATNWISSNPSVLTVNSNGLITAVGNVGGNATISATVFGTTATSALITVPQAAPPITQEPVPVVNLVAGGTLHASIANVGLPPYTYYWYFNNGSGSNLISGATTATLTLANMQAANSGSYTCVVSNAYGGTGSTATALTVFVPTPYQANLLALKPLAYWPLEETSGTVAYDMAGGYNGTYLGGFSLQGAGVPNAVFGSPSYAAAFDGTTGYVDIPEGPFNITNAVTVLAWANVQAYPTFGGLVGHGDASYRLSVNGTGFPGGNDGTVAGDATGPTAIVDGNWHLMAYTYTGIPGANSGSLYVDGALVASNNVTTAPVGDGRDLWIAGAPDYGTARLLNSLVAHVTIFNRALSALEVNALYTGQPIMTVTTSGTSVVITWGSGTLMQSPTLPGTWTPVSGAVAPFYTVPSPTGTMFYQVQP